LIIAMPKVLLIAPTPNADNPQSLAAQAILEGKYDELEVHWEALDFATPGETPARWNWAEIRQLFSSISRLKKTCRALQPDVLVYFVGQPVGIALLRDSLVLSAIRPLVPQLALHLQFAGLEAASARLPGFLRGRFQRAFQQPALVIAANREAEKEAAFLGAQGVVVVPYGLPDAWEDGPRRDWNPEPAILYWPTVVSDSAIELLIESCRQLKERGYEFRCKVVLPSSVDTSPYRKKAEAVGGWVSFIPPAAGDAKWDLFAGTDFYCLPEAPSPEIFDAAVIEAMMSGLPVVGTQTGALPEIVAEGKSAFLAPAGDIKGLTDRLAKVVKDQLLRQIMGNSGRNRYLQMFHIETFRETMGQILGGKS
jgi:glycosyltransferase involved in cell wall biosynthesis